MNVIDPAVVNAPRDDTIISIAILAVGGQGGGVLTDWITDLAERNGYRAQSTSVAGVAQRTGATIYYVEMCPDRGREPVFALSPSPGDVDILIAAELMEAGRAIMRGFVTPDRTTLIASSHRIAAISEKIAPGDGRASSDEVLTAAEVAAERFIAFDMETIAVGSGTVISSSLFGALAGSGRLPFGRESYEATIRASGRGVEASLKAFRRAHDRAAGVGDHGGPPSPLPDMQSPDAGLMLSGEPESAAVETNLGTHGPAGGVAGPPLLIEGWQTLLQRLDPLPRDVQAVARHGLRKVVDYQDLAYGAEYLDWLDRAFAIDQPEHDYALSKAAAKHLANAMCYDDIIRVADLKTRSSRNRRVRGEVGVNDSNVLHLTEYFHPRIEEFCGSLPASLGSWIEDRPKLMRWLDRGINRGRRIRTDSALGFSMLWVVAGLRRWRRALLRHQVETAHLEQWYQQALDRVAFDYSLAVEILNCRRLIKGYSDTHARGLSKFDRVLSGLRLLEGRPDAADWLRRLKEAALKDEDGKMLDGALQTVASFSAPAETVRGRLE